jgi:putative tryptophan/tyrosine transport system substrate-binding protein
LKGYFSALCGAIPDLTMPILDLISEGDTVMVRNRVRGTHQGDFGQLKATGKTFDIAEAFPAISKLGCLALHLQWDGPIVGPAIREAAEAAHLPLTASLLEFNADEADYRVAIQNLSRDGANAVMVVDSPSVFHNSTLIANLLGEAKFPAMFTFVEPVTAGGLMAYSFDLVELNKRIANNIDAILRGAKPGDIPFYQATKFELSINLKTAKQLGLSVPPSLLASADNIIE